MDKVKVEGADAARPDAAAIPPAAPQTPSAQIIAAAGGNQVVATDKTGRRITTNKLSVIQRTRLFKMVGPGNSQNLPLMGYYFMAGSVTAIDGDPVAFPTSEAQIEALLTRLDDAGLDALADAWKKAGWADEKNEGDPANIKN